MDYTAAQEKGRTDATHDQIGCSQQLEQVCDHTIELFDPQGRLRGSWIGEDSPHGTRYACQRCGKFYGYQPDKKSQEAMYQAYLEQQRRLNCPGCGDSPFMG